MHLWGAAEKSVTSLRGLLLSVQVFCLIKMFRSKSGTYQRQSAALGCGAARGTAALEGVDGGGVGSWRKEKKISVWDDSRRYQGGYLRASQVTSTTPSTSAWQQRGVSSAGQTEPGARSWIMAGIAAAMAAKARMVNCILAFEGFLVSEVVLVLLLLEVKLCCLE